VNLNRNQIAVSNAQSSSDVRQFRALRGLKTPRRSSDLRSHDRPKADIHRSVSVAIVLVAALLTTEVQALSIRCRDVAAGTTAPRRVFGVDQLESNSDRSGLISQEKLSLSIRPTVDFRAEVFSLAQRSVSNVRQVLNDDVPCCVCDGVSDQFFTCPVEQGHRYGSFVTAHTPEKATRATSANGLNECAFAPDAGTAMVFHPAFEKECFGVGRVCGDHQPLDAKVHTDDTAFGFEFWNLNLMCETQIPDLANPFDFGILPSVNWNGWVLQCGELAKNRDALLVAEQVAFVGQWNRRAFVDAQIPFSESLQGFVAGGDLSEKRAGQLRREFELSADGRVVGAGQPIRVEFLRLEHLLGYPTGGSKVVDGKRVEMLGLTDFDLDCSDSFQYNSQYRKLLSMSTPKTTTGTAALKGGVSDPRRFG